MMDASNVPTDVTANATGRLAPWVQQQCQKLLSMPGHAWLLQGPSGLGQYGLAMALAKSWLCEQATEEGACGVCESCHAIDVHAHADLCVLMPEIVMLQREWPLDERAQAEIDEKKRKPSKEIRVEAMRSAIEFAQRTNARGRGKVMLIYPAERMNHVTANALLKTLEEPPGNLRFVLASEAAHQLLPTLRSRCLIHTMAWPGDTEALHWLQAQGLKPEDAKILLHAAGQRPEDALRYVQEGRGAEQWRQLPKDMAAGQLNAASDWSPAQLIDAQQKLCHDLYALAVRAEPRFFQALDLPQPPALATLKAWEKDLNLEARGAEHPFHAGLMLESLVSRAQSALN